MTHPGKDIRVITRTSDLAAFCRRLAEAPFATIDTEFMRESTFWPQLCLIQMAGPAEAAIVDPLAPGLDLVPFFQLMADESVVKVFHAARQDVEIFVHQAGAVPRPLFDTQVAAMVCGYGDQVSYEQLVLKITGERIDKSLRFTDWARRPLSGRQLAYALSDVIHLRDVYLKLKANLEAQGRTHWLAEEMAVLTDVETYRTHPEDAWQRLKLRVRKPRQLAVMQSLAAWREVEAQTRDVPRQRVLKDEAIYEIAQSQPRDRTALAELRAIPRGFERSATAGAILVAVERALALPERALPRMPKQRPPPERASAAAELLKVLLKMVAERHGVAPRIIATSEDLERIAAEEEPPVPALRGWRRELFGRQALALKRGELALAVGERGVTLLTREDLRSAAE
jgi:ribonuclease D